MLPSSSISIVEAFLAALEMLNRMNNLNESVRDKGYEIGLKIGIHNGPALAVMSDERLDYFGQSVNIAARIQGLAGSGEIWLSDSAFGSPGVKDKLSELGYSTEQKEATLKGVGEKAVVHRISR